MWSGHVTCYSVPDEVPGYPPVSDATCEPVIIVSDLQLTDFYSYGMAKGSVSLSLTQYYSDAYMKRSFRLVASSFGARAKNVVILGDIFDGGRLLGDESSIGERSAHVLRLCDILGCAASDAMRQTDQAGGRRLWFTSGNHDIGIAKWWSQGAQDAFRLHFGSPTFRFQVNDVHFIAVDSPSLAYGADDRALRTWNEIDQAVRSVPHGAPKALLSHIPLWRSVREPCGSLRQKPALRQGYGVSYQNLLDDKVSKRLLERMGDVSIVFSGDDHDICVVKRSEGAPEATIPTFSWLQGVKRPGFAIASTCRAKHDDAPTVQAHVCFLPSQLGTFAIYILMGAAHVAAVVFKTCFRPTTTTSGNNKKFDDAEAAALRGSKGEAGRCYAFSRAAAADALFFAGAYTFVHAVEWIAIY